MLGLDDACRAFRQNVAQAREKYADDLSRPNMYPIGMDLNLVFSFASLPTGTIAGDCKDHEDEATEEIIALTQFHEYVYNHETRNCRLTAKQVHDALKLIYVKAQPKVDASEEPKTDASR